MKNALGSPQTLLVLGGSSEIGVATACRLAAGRTRTVVLAGRSPVALGEAADRVRTAGATRVETVSFDARHPDRHSAVLADAVEQMKADVDVVLIAAGVLGDQIRDEVDGRSALEVLETNFTGCASIGIAALNHLRRQGHGSLVVLSSVAAERPRRDNFVYGASKAGLDAFFQGYTDALAGSPVEVIVVRPGFVVGRMTAGMKRAPFATSPEAVAASIESALGRGSSTVWVPSALRLLMSGLRHVPRPLFRRIPR